MIRATGRVGTAVPGYAFYYSTLGASLASSDGLKTWYLTLGGKTDTLYYDVQKTRPNDPLFRYDVKAVLFNGQVALREHPSQPPLYVFRRKR
ncbi:hypothetical protein CDA63_13330 [Hymenobacter amundsenii]|uniref:Uncharacterized protein n=1 Tax=Hymenobacter amundsenii TaxID=2006685 RepID=A0A246FJ86_9BACT|nr:hypothetical protein [Hymenobacter amundsenii]OWP62618.1 hypothetical protein CDA63_13330 [Hymenobacter amundsenii]